ncbi:hypothetical protein Cco03nite_75190 [Catellatospora coxensis]|uniref:Uncharacterized protein n=1 Tax=Catellatospora coxensis TaxID=310354 RepID=A0A8J3PBP4_9ACTN|nr:hypothetical protein Cco03nite_75190 [Catellatospora coxensis]
MTDGEFGPSGWPLRHTRALPATDSLLFGFGGRPDLLPLGNNGCSAAHCAAVRSRRVAASKVATMSLVSVSLGR